MFKATGAMFEHARLCLISMPTASKSGGPNGGGYRKTFMENKVVQNLRAASGDKSLLKPWHHLVSAEGVLTAAYADDRSIKAAAGSCTEAAALVDRALTTTASFATPRASAQTQRKGSFGKPIKSRAPVHYVLLGGAPGSSVDNSGFRAPWVDGIPSSML